MCVLDNLDIFNENEEDRCYEYKVKHGDDIFYKNSKYNNFNESSDSKVRYLEDCILNLSSGNTVKGLNTLVGNINYKRYLKSNKKSFAIQRIRNVLDSYILLGQGYSKFVVNSVNGLDNELYKFYPEKTKEILNFLCRDIFNCDVPKSETSFNKVIEMCFDYYCTQKYCDYRYGLNFDNYIEVCTNIIPISSLMLKRENLILIKPNDKEIVISKSPDSINYSIPNIKELNLDMSNLKYTVKEILKTSLPLKLIIKLCNHIYDIVDIAEYEHTKTFSTFNSFLLLDYPKYHTILNIIKNCFSGVTVSNFIVLCYEGRDLISTNNKIGTIEDLSDFLDKVESLMRVF